MSPSLPFSSSFPDRLLLSDTDSESERSSAFFFLLFLSSVSECACRFLPLFWVSAVFLTFLCVSVLLLLQVLPVLGDLRPRANGVKLFSGLSIISGLLVLLFLSFLLPFVDSRVCRVRILCRPLTESSSLTGWKRKGDGSRDEGSRVESRGLSRGRSSP